MQKKLCIFGLCLSLLISLLAGCGGSTEGTASAEQVSAETSAEVSAPEEPDAAPEPVEAESALEASVEEPSAEDQAPAENETITYFPVDESVEISVWMAYPPIFGGIADNGPADFSVYQELQARTNVTLTFDSCSFIGANEAFNLMVASGDYDDILWSLASYYTNGYDAAINSDVIIDLTEYIEAYMPNYSAYLDKDPATYRNSVITNEGNIGYISYLEDNTNSFNQNGFCIRADWLEELGLEKPVTIEEYENVMAGFQTELSVAHPMYMNKNGFYFGGYLGSAFDISTDFNTSEGVGRPYYVIDGTVSFAPLEDEFYDYLSLVHDWYTKGFIDPDFITSGSDENQADNEQIYNNEMGIWITAANTINYNEYSDVEEGFSAEALKSPRMTADQVLHITQQTLYVSSVASASISTGCDEDKYETVFRVLDYLYTDEGITLMNWGTEDVSYTVDEDGTYHYTDLVKNNPDGYNQDVTITYYTGGSTLILGVKDPATYNDLYSETQLAAMNVWTNADDGDYMLPTGTTILAADQDDYNAKWSDVLTYLQECIVRFIVGDMSLESDYEFFVDSLITMGAEDCVHYMQIAYDSYMSR